MKNLITLLSLTLIAGPAFADQCAWTDLAVARRGVALVKAIAGVTGEDPSVYELCENCGETIANIKRVKLDADPNNSSGLDVTYKMVSPTVKVANEPTYWQFTMNAKSGNTVTQDLAYLYVKTAAGVYANVATLVNCPVSGVTPVFYVGK